VSIKISDTKKSLYITNNNKITGDISSIIIPHDFAIGVNGLSKRLVVHGTARFESDVQIIGTLYGGSPVKIAGGIKIVGGAEVDGVDLSSTISDVPDIKNRIGVVETDYIKSTNLDEKITDISTNSTTTFGTKILTLQTKTSLTADVEAIESYCLLQTDLATTKSSLETTANDLVALHDTLSVSSFESGEKVALLSDRRLKNEIKKIQDPFKIINRIEPVTYYWNETASKLNCYDKDLHFGFIAQNIRDVIPTIVSAPDINGNLSIKVNSLELMSVLVSAVQDQQKQIEELKSKVLEIENSNI